MSNYKTLKGLFIKHVSSDPSNTIEGQIWYNTTSQTIKIAPLIAAWSSGTNLPNATGGCRGNGTQTAGLVSAGRVSGTGITESYEYDGTDWTAAGDVNQARSYHAAMGTQTAGLACGGADGGDANSEEYNGSSWTEGDNLNTGRNYLGSAGTQTAGLVICGNPPPMANVEEYNGTSWSEVTNNPTARRTISSIGTQTAAIAVGNNASTSTQTELYDGTNWTEGPAINTGRRYLGGFGIQTSALVAGGWIPPNSQNATETYDGTSWTTSPATLATAAYDFANAGTTDAGFKAGKAAGEGSVGAQVEEWTKSVTTRSVDTT